MNAERRKRLQQARDKLAEIAEMLDGIGQDEQAALDNMPDGIQEGEKGQKLQENADTIQELRDEIDDIATRIEEIEQ